MPKELAVSLAPMAKARTKAMMKPRMIVHRTVPGKLTTRDDVHHSRVRLQTLEIGKHIHDHG